MTNETTASQPKSIGDDAQFRELLLAWHMEYSENRFFRVAQRFASFDALAAYIDNFRAPAAQASATIQAAPDADIAAGLQRVWGMIGGEGQCPVAAPMVADPAGVVAKVAGRREDFANYSEFDEERIYVRGWNDCLAATVKAVPSEALEVVESESALPELKLSQEWCCGGCGSGVVKTPKRTNFEYSREEFPNGSVISKTTVKYVAPCCGGDLMLWDESRQECIAWNYVQIAAPLAEKTGGGE